jgi:hypothetical protein
MDEAHLAAALRYLSLNPVRARLVECASTSAHLRGRDDGLTAQQDEAKALSVTPGVRSACKGCFRRDWEQSVMRAIAVCRVSRDQIPNRLFGNLSSSKWRFGNFVLNFAASHNDRI